MDGPGSLRWLGTAVVVPIVCLLVFAPAQASDGHWTVAAVDGRAALSPEQGVAYAASRGQDLGPGTTVNSGEDGTVVLVQHRSSIIVYPNSEVTIAGTAVGGHPGVVQRSGAVLYRIEPRTSWNFEVRTPYLLATVKGTVFVVAVADEQASVSVATGIVHVVPVRGGHRDIVRAGNRALVVAATADQVKVDRIDLGSADFWSAGRADGEPPSDRPDDVGLQDGQSSGGASSGDTPGGGGPAGGNPGAGSSRGDNPGDGGPAGGNPGNAGSRGGDSRGNRP